VEFRSRSRPHSAQRSQSTAAARWLTRRAQAPQSLLRRPLLRRALDWTTPQTGYGPRPRQMRQRPFAFRSQARPTTHRQRRQRRRQSSATPPGQPRCVSPQPSSQARLFPLLALAPQSQTTLREAKPHSRTPVPAWHASPARFQEFLSADRMRLAPRRLVRASLQSSVQSLLPPLLLPALPRSLFRQSLLL